MVLFIAKLVCLGRFGTARQRPQQFVGSPGITALSRYRGSVTTFVAGAETVVDSAAMNSSITPGSSIVAGTV